MANITYPPPRPLTIGEVLDLSFRIFGGTLVRCLGFSILAVLASQAPNIYLLLRHRGSLTQALFSQSNDPLYWVIYAVGALLVLAFYGAIVLRQHRMITDAAVGSEFAAAARRLPGMVLLLIVFALIVAVPVVAFSAGAGAGSPSLIWTGVLLLIPACYLYVQLSCSGVGLLISGAGAMASLARSWRLTQGSFWRLTVIYTVAIIIILVAYFLLTVIATALAAVLGRGDVVVIMAAYTVVIIALGALLAPFYTALALAIFGDLSVRKEGADLAQRISASA
jgi:hypothetical protein